MGDIINQVYLYPSSSTGFESRRLLIHSDGNCGLLVDPSPRFDGCLKFVGASQNLACFLYEKEGWFMLWNTETRAEERFIYFSPPEDVTVDYVTCFGHDEVKIVCIVCDSESWRYKVHTSEAAGQVSGGFYRADGVFQENASWDGWHGAIDYQCFEFDMAQPPRYVDSSIYWHGSVNGVSKILTYDLDNNEFSMIASPFPSPVVLGHGFFGGLAATYFEIIEENHVVLIWGLDENKEWLDMLDLRLSTDDGAPEATYPYIPISFLGEIGYMFFLYEGHIIRRMILVEVEGDTSVEVEDLYSTGAHVVTSFLSPPET